MKNITKAAILSAAVALVCQGAYAATDDLILGFTGNSATTDTTFNLGTFSTTSISTGTLGALSGSPFTSSGVFGFTAQNGASQGTGIDVSVARTGSNAGSVKGTESAPAVFSGATTLAAANSDVKSIIIGSGTTSFTGNSYSANTVAANPPAQNDSVFSDDNGVSSLVANGTTMDIYQLTIGPSSGHLAVKDVVTYVGELELFNTGGVESYVFDPSGVSAAVPEPATYGALAGAGLLALSLRRQFRRSNA
jgi:hypothetical protein